MRCNLRPLRAESVCSLADNVKMVSVCLRLPCARSSTDLRAFLQQWRGTERNGVPMVPFILFTKEYSVETTRNSCNQLPERSSRYLCVYMWLQVPFLEPFSSMLCYTHLCPRRLQIYPRYHIRYVVYLYLR